ncbi:hypothetical protein V8D89_008214 [Ganoderma adspersum]
MKFFNIFLTAVFVALLGVVGSMAQTSDEVITAIESFINASRTLDTQITGLNAINFPTMGFIIADGFNNITGAVNIFNAEFSPETPPYPDDVAVVVIDLLTTFVQVVVAILNLIIGKHSLAAMFALTAPIAAALQGLKGVVVTFILALINLIPTQEDAALALLNELCGGFTLAITTYSS